MAGLLGRRRLVDQIAAELADVDEHGAALGDQVVPEVAGREPALEHHRAAVQEGRAERAEPAGGVVHGQRHIDPVARLRVRRAGEAAHVELGAHVGDARGLRHPRRARGEDQQRCLPGGHVGAEAAVGGELAAALQRLGQIPLIPVGGAHHPLLQRPLQQRARGAEHPGRLGVDDDVLGAADVQAVRQRQAGELVVDQRGDDADLRKTVPDREILDAIGHEERHRLAAPQVEAFPPMGESVGHGVELAIGQRPAFEGDGGPVAPPGDRGFQIVADEIVGVSRDGLHPLQRPVQPMQKTPLALEPCLKGHPLLRPGLGAWRRPGRRVKRGRKRHWSHPREAKSRPDDSASLRTCPAVKASL